MTDTWRYVIRKIGWLCFVRVSFFVGALGGGSFEPMSDVSTLSIWTVFF